MKNQLHLHHNSHINNGDQEEHTQNEYIDSSSSTPFVSAPSSPGRTTSNPTFFYSAPTSPMHFLLSSNTSILTPQATEQQASEVVQEEFDFDASFYPMSSADELFLNGQIRKHQLQKLEEEDEQGEVFDERMSRSEIKKLRNRSLRRIRSMSPIRDHEFIDDDDNNNNNNNKGVEEEKSDDVEARDNDAPPSLRRNSKRWVMLKEFLYRSKSEGRNNGRHNYFWSFSLVKDKKTPPPTFSGNDDNNKKKKKQVKENKKKKSAEESCSCVERDNNVVTSQVQTRNSTRTEPLNVRGGKRLGLSAHYSANKAQAEEMRRKTYLPYRQGIFGCLGGGGGTAAFNGFAARALNSVSSN